MTDVWSKLDNAQCSKTWKKVQFPVVQYITSHQVVGNVEKQNVPSII